MPNAPGALTPHRFHILAALAACDLHGSGIVRDVLDQTDGALRLWPATLYGALDDLEGEGLIRELDDPERPDGTSHKRRYYRITRDGRAALAQEAERLRAVAGRAMERLERA
jgi:DNA-binding PadR family transcriptional regulator